MMGADERLRAAALGDGPLAMFDDGLPLQFLHGPEKPAGTEGLTDMEFSSKHEDEWLRRATDAAIAGARKIALGSGPLMNTPVGRLTDHNWGMIVAAVIFAWVEKRVEQAIAEGRDSEQVVRLTGLSPSPCDVAVVKSVLPELADTAGIDWSLPLASWSPDVMTGFLMLAWKLISAAEVARDHGASKVLQKSEVGRDEMAQEVPFDL